MRVREFKSLDWFITESQVRHSQPAMQEMAASLKEHGQLQDVIAEANGTLITGYRRLGGAKLIPLDGLWVQIEQGPISTGEKRTIRLVENIQREDLTPYEVALGVKELVEESGLELKKVAARLGKGPTFVTRNLYPFKCIEVVQAAFKAGAIGITDCEAMAKATPDEQQRMLEARLNHHATRDDLVRRRQRARNGSSTAVRVNRIRFPLPGGVTITLVGHDLAMDLAIDSLLDGAKAMRKGRADGLDAKTFQAAMQCKAKGG